MFSRVLIANRGEIACRIARTCCRLGIQTIAVYSDPDRHAPHVLEADFRFRLGEAPAAQSYLCVSKILEAARIYCAEAIHPGYGFLSENAAFARQCVAAGVRFIGPRPEQIEAFAKKHIAREFAQNAGVPVVPGSKLLHSLSSASEAASSIGYPVMLKSTAGGGGIGMRACHSAEDLSDVFESVSRLAGSNFGERGVFLEKLIERARHIEVQIFGCKGQVLTLGERDCSLQRRNQKVIEETPAPGLDDAERTALFAAARRLAEAAGYSSAGTVEFLFDDKTRQFYFLEVNTRLQVEHGVTEAVTGIDLVEWMLREAAGEDLQLDSQNIRVQGSAIEARVYAEDPWRNFQPCSGVLTHVRFPFDVRIDTWVGGGTEVLPYYDSLLAKIIVHDGTREAAIKTLQSALAETSLDGMQTNLEYLRDVTAERDFVAGRVDTGLLARCRFEQRALEVLTGGMQTSVQDYPGRLGYWAVGVPPSGPMDSLAFRIANRIVGNRDSAAAMEITMIGPELRFRSATVLALTGADCGATLDGRQIPCWTRIEVAAGSVLKTGSVLGNGVRSYLAVRGGILVPNYLGSASTFLLGGFGGHAGRALRAGDVLSFGKAVCLRPEPPPLTTNLSYTHAWCIGVLPGPHGAPEFFTPEYIQAFFDAQWKVHHHSDRTGVRLIGPKPGWARTDGGEAGLHPSNIHDNAYAVGTIDFTGDMPIILGPDGPSLGGFVCPATIVHAELWKIGQLRAGDVVEFKRMTQEQAEEMDLELETFLAGSGDRLPTLPEGRAACPEVVLRSQVSDAPRLVVRADGDRALLIELGPNRLDMELRLRIHAIERSIEQLGLRGIIDITSGIRSLQIHYDTRVLSRAALLDAIETSYREGAQLEDIDIEARTLWLPLSWDDPSTREAIERYTRTVNPNAPWAPSNIEFIRRINGLDSIDDVRRIVFDASYVVLGLGDVYLGAPVATPLDPRHRLVTTKYNPARTWTPQNAVGIGGAYLCVYGMEGPGGYQFVGRTVQMWNTYRQTGLFSPEKPWLLRVFDQIRFYPVSAAELLELRDAFPYGRYRPRIEANQFRLSEYRRLSEATQAESELFRITRESAFRQELERWKFLPPLPEAAQSGPPDEETGSTPEGVSSVDAPLTASVWKILVEAGEPVQIGQTIVVLEAMKTEIVVVAPVSGVVERTYHRAGALVTAGQRLALIRKVD